MEENSDFNVYIDAYKHLPLQEKKALVLEEIKKILAFMEKLKLDLNIQDKILFNREILDLNNDNISDDDFVEAIFVYIHSIQESTALYADAITKILYN